MINIIVMRKKFFLGLLFGLFLPLSLIAQTREDVVAISTAIWETKKISENIEVRQMRWPLLYGCAQTVTVAEITPKRSLEFDIAIADGGATVSEMAQRTKALVGINGCTSVRPSPIYVKGAPFSIQPPPPNWLFA